MVCCVWHECNALSRLAWVKWFVMVAWAQWLFDTREKRSAHACLPCFRREFACASPNRNYTRYQNKLDSGREIQKSKLHTLKISLEFHEHKVYWLLSLFCTTYFPPCNKGENHVWKSTLALAALRGSHCCCFGHHVAELGQCEQRKRPMHAKWKNKEGKTLLCLILEPAANH